MLIKIKMNINIWYGHVQFYSENKYNPEIRNSVDYFNSRQFFTILYWNNIQLTY